MFESSRIELSRKALRQNLGYLSRRIGSGPVFCSVIKGNAYGHGIETFLPLAESCGIDHFAVSSADEAYRAVRASTRRSHVIIMGDVHPDAVEWAVENECGLYVFGNERLEEAVTAARLLGKPAHIHLEVETGLHRTGLEGDSLERAVQTVKAHGDEIVLDGICTHFAGAESIANQVRIYQQTDRFNEQVRQVHAAGLRPRQRHMACSAAALTYPESIMDMVRIGIAQYGFWPSEETRMRVVLEQETSLEARRRDPLRRVLRWVSRIMHIKSVRPGEFVGYGNAYLTSRTQKLAAIPVGYHHGFARRLSNLGHVLVHGRRAPVAGIVNMNMMMVDVTDLPAARVGDEVVIIGKQKRADASVASFADMTRYLNYEVLVRLSPDIPRVVVD